MEGQNVFVVFEWRDYRKENEASVLSVHLNRSKAIETMEKAISEFNSDNCYVVERFEDKKSVGANVINGVGYEIFEVVEKKLLM